jgi:hypothetical protein
MDMTTNDLAYIHQHLVGTVPEGTDLAASLAARLNDRRSDFEIAQMGGGCTVLWYQLPDGRVLYLTHGEGGTHEADEGDAVLLGLYDHLEEEMIGSLDFTATCSWRDNT